MKIVKSDSGNKVMLKRIGGSAGQQKRGKETGGASLAELAGGWSEKEDGSSRNRCGSSRRSTEAIDHFEQAGENE
jgi:hypothetical protein